VPAASCVPLCGPRSPYSACPVTSFTIHRTIALGKAMTKRRSGTSIILLLSNSQSASRYRQCSRSNQQNYLGKIPVNGAITTSKRSETLVGVFSCLDRAIRNLRGVKLFVHPVTVPQEKEPVAPTSRRACRSKVWR
jgi:hypothetical protein